MISVEEALERILGYLDALPAEEKPILEAMSLVLAEDIVATCDIPPLDNTAMDGYAVRAEDTAGAAPKAQVELQVIGEVAAGYTFPSQVTPGTAVRIMTGAAIPQGANAVVPFEETDEPSKSAHKGRRRGHGQVRIFKEATVGDHIRQAGEDVQKGHLVIRRGTVLRPPEIGVLASLGQATVRVVRRPVIAVLSTGDELVQVGQPKPASKIYDANAYSLAALIQRHGAVPKALGIARDTVSALKAKIRRGLASDMLITSAGVSRGDYDVVKDVLAKEGEISFWTVAMKPGKPLAFGCFYSGGRRIPHVGLPGNPVSAMVAFELFVRPAIFKMMGKTHQQRPLVKAIAQERIVNHGDRRRLYDRCIVREKNGRYYASPTGPQGSGILTSMTRANALTMIPEGRQVVEPGDEIEVIMLDWSQGQEWGTDLSGEDGESQ
jgi:molybdopterin molybdotransferase